MYKLTLSKNVKNKKLPYFGCTHIYFIRLKPLDIELMKKLHNKVNIVPVIAKSDVLTKKEIQKLKKRVIKNIINFLIVKSYVIIIQ